MRGFKVKFLSKTNKICREYIKPFIYVYITFIASIFTIINKCLLKLILDHIYSIYSFKAFFLFVLIH